MTKIVPLIEASSSGYEKKYKCPYCELRLTRQKLPPHIDNKHADMIPEGYTALRVAFNAINHKDHGECIICKREAPWNEEKGRYERLCGRQECIDAYKEMARKRNKNVYGTEIPQSDPRYKEEIQKKALAHRKISGKYRFGDGGYVEYTGSYEKKLLEYMDKIMHINSYDIAAPGPSIFYMYDGEEHLYISDFLYIPYNLIIEVKDGGSNKNNNQEMKSSREKTIAKEEAVKKDGKYNYLRLTDNDFSQLMEAFAVLKWKLLDEDTDEKYFKVNEFGLVAESVLLEAHSKIDPNHKQEEKLYLSSFEKIKATDSSLQKYKNILPASKYRSLKSLIKDGEDFSTISYFYIDSDKFVASCSVSKYDDGDIVIHGVDISKPYRGHGLSYQLLDVCTKELGGFMLAVDKKNEIAYKSYLKYGFIVYTENKQYYYMVLKSKKKLVEKYIHEALLEIASDIDKDHKQKGKILLSKFKRVVISLDSIKEFKSSAKFLSHFRTGKDYTGYIWIDKDKVVAACNVHISENEIQAIEITKDYQGYGLSYQILDVCTKDLNGYKLTVNKSNQVAISLYKKYGFVIYKETDAMYFMVLKSKKNMVNTKKEMTESMNATIAAALAPERAPVESDPNNYMMVQHLQNNKMSYGITKDPQCNEFISVSIKDGMQVHKMDKSNIDKVYTVFKMKDKRKAKEVYDEAVNMLRMGAKVDSTDYFYKRYTGHYILTHDQICFDESFELITPFYDNINALAESVEEFIKTDDRLYFAEQTMKEIERIAYGK